MILLTCNWPALPWKPRPRNPLLGRIRGSGGGAERDALLYPVVNGLTDEAPAKDAFATAVDERFPPLKPRNRHKVFDLRWTAARTPIDFFELKHAIVRIECGKIVGIQLVEIMSTDGWTTKTGRGSSEGSVSNEEPFAPWPKHMWKTRRTLNEPEGTCWWLWRRPTSCKTTLDEIEAPATTQRLRRSVVVVSHTRDHSLFHSFPWTLIGLARTVGSLEHL